jgi:hypothetical protein
MPNAPRPPAQPPRKGVRALKAAARLELQQALRLVTEEDEARFKALRDDLIARYAPIDHVELHWIEEMAFIAWRQDRLRAFEARVLARDGAPDPDRPHPDPFLLLDEFVRYGDQLERDWRNARARLDVLRRSRPPGAEPLAIARAAQLRWLADRVDEEAAAAATAATAPTPAPEPARAEPEPERTSAVVIPFDPSRRRRVPTEPAAGGGDGAA